MSAMLAEFFRHNLWANLRLIDACAGLSEETLDATLPGTFGSVRETLVHIVNGEVSYRARIAGGERPISLPNVSSIDELREYARSISIDELRERARTAGEALIATAEQADADRVIEGTWCGEPHAYPLSTLLIQAINHGADHRSQIATILTQHGIEPPNIDGWTYDDERRG